MTNLPPGRELDALVAQKVMGVQIEWVTAQGQKIPTIMGQPFYIKPYSTSIADAWLVVEKLKDMGFSIDVSAFPSNRKWLEPPYRGAHAQEWTLTKSVHYQCDISRYEETIEMWTCHCDADSDTPSHTICLAALKAVEER